MTEQEKLIRQIKEEFDREKHTKSYDRVKNMAKIISENLYSEDSHFVYELIQNAQDNEYKTKIKKLDFFVYSDGILIKNNEIGFNTEQIKSICDFAQSVKQGKKALGYIGEKGIGFKSVFAITDKPAIYSNGYRFYFKKDEYIEPYWIDDLSKYPKEFQDENTTNIYLPYANSFQNKLDIEKKIRDIEPILLLFLDNLDEINIYHTNKQILSVHKSFIKENGQDIVILNSANKQYKFVVFSKIIDCKENIIEEKRKGVKQRKIIIAFPLREIEDSRIFAFLPTKIYTHLPFIIQADFLLNASREDILRNKEWNKWLLDEIVIFFVEIFKDLKQIDKFGYLKYLKEKGYRYYFFGQYYENILEKLKKERLFLTTEQQWVASNEVILLDKYDFMIKYLKNIKHKQYIHKDFYIPNHIIDLWNIQTIDDTKFIKILGDNYQAISLIFKSNHLLFEQLVEYLEGIQSKIDSDLLNLLPIIPFDTDNGIEFKTKEQLGSIMLFYKLDEQGILKEIFSNIKNISTKYINKLEKVSFYKNKFGIKQPNLLEILDNLSEDIIKNSDSNVKLLVYIKNNLSKNKNKIIELLKKNYSFLSKEEKFISYYQINRLYISKEYLVTDTCIENIVNKYCEVKSNQYFNFLTTKYLDYDLKYSEKSLEVLKQEWIDFLKLLNINDKLKIVTEVEEIRCLDSKSEFRYTNEYCDNIPFISIRDSNSYKDEFKQNLQLNKLGLDDSIYLFKQIISLSKIELEYRKVTDFYRDFKYKRKKIPWIEVIKNDYSIYINKKSYKISNFYTKTDKRISKFFYTVPKEYLTSNASNISTIFNLKNEPSNDEVISLINDEKLVDIKEVINVFIYLKEKNIQAYSLIKIPIENNNSIQYINKSDLIWEDESELNLICIKKIYGEEFKSFFIDLVGIKEKPSIEQYRKFLLQQPNNYQKHFYKFIEKLSEESYLPYDISDYKLCKINNNFYSFNEIVYNDEQLQIDNISNLLTIDKRYMSIFDKLIYKCKIKKLSSLKRDIVISNKQLDEDLYNIYIRLLNFTWDFIYSHDIVQFNRLKENENFILETKNVKQGAWADVDLKIYFDTKEVSISQNITIQEEIIYLSKKIDIKTKTKIISQFISEKINIDFEKLELFYMKVYQVAEYTLEEYYKENDIQIAEGEDSFDNVFQKILNNNVDMSDEENIKKDDTNNEKKHLIAEEEATSNNVNEKVYIKSNNIEDKKATKPSLDKKISKKQVVCPECNVYVNEQNLNKHLCKVHHLNCNQENQLKKGIQNHEKDISKNDDELNLSIISDQEAYREQIQQQYNSNIDKSNSGRKQKYASRQVKVGRKETRMFLKKQYNGYCQICGFTFEQKSHKGKYFELFDWLSKKISKENSNIVDAGSSLCLCSRCHSGVKYGDFEAKFLSKLHNVDWSNISFDEFVNKTNLLVNDYEVPECYDFVEMDMYKIPIRLFNKEQSIFYTEEHFLHFYNLLTLSK